MQRAEKEAWRQKVQKKEPDSGDSNKKKSKQVKAVNFLVYANKQNEGQERASSSRDAPMATHVGKRMAIKEVRREDCKGLQIFNQRTQVRNFLIQLEWSDEEPEGGITWLELHALFRLHGGQVVEEGEEHDPSRTDTTCTQSMQGFKSVVRWVTTHGVRAEDEWKLQTSYARLNRLAGLGVSNKHAAVRGMPVLTQTQAKAIATQIMRDKGHLAKKKDKMSWEAQNLYVFSGPFYFKRETVHNQRGPPTGKVASGKGRKYVADHGFGYGAQDTETTAAAIGIHFLPAM